MVKLESGSNSFYIENDQNIETVDSYIIQITSEFNNNDKEIELESADVNARYIQFDLELVIDSEEDLSTGKVHLTPGLHKIKIYEDNTSNELLYTNILFVEYSEEEISTFKYINDNGSTFVY